MFTGGTLPGTANSNPVKAAYNLWTVGSFSRSSWDPLTVLYAVRGNESNWSLQTGINQINVNDGGNTCGPPQGVGDQKVAAVNRPVGGHQPDRVADPLDEPRHHQTGRSARYSSRKRLIDETGIFARHAQFRGPVTVEREHGLPGNRGAPHLHAGKPRRPDGQP